MKFMIGDIVSRRSYNNDILFKIIEIDNYKALLKGIDVRLIADSDLDDLIKVVEPDKNKLYQDDSTLTERAISSMNLDRSEYFYLPGKILHIDTEFQLNNTLANPYKIRKKSIFENGKIN